MREPDILRFPMAYDRHAFVQLAWDPTGTRLAVAARDKLLAVHLRGGEVLVLGEPRKDVRSMAWSPDGDSLAVAYEDRDLQQLLRTADGVELWRSSIGETAIDDVVWSPDGRLLAHVGDALVVCAAETGAVRWRREEKRTRHVPGIETRLAGAQVRVIERVRLEEDLIPCCEARWSPDGRLLMARWESGFRVLGARDGELKAGGDATRGALRWSSWGDALFQEGDNRLGECALHIVDPLARSVTFSPDGRLVAAEGNNHRLWIQDPNGVRAVTGHPRTITAMAWSARGTLATACRDGLVRRLSHSGGELETWARLDVMDGGLVWSPDGRHLAAACAESLVVLPWSDLPGLMEERLESCR